MNSRIFSVIIKRVIAVDSAEFAYVEVPLDNNIVLLGAGNLGKSSVVNAVRFFLLPESNVNNADKKFGFISGSGDSADVSYYSKDEIYNHYFPSSDSRLILEVEHQLLDGSTRSHCQVISRGGNYRLTRSFVPAPYNDIAHLFWDKHSVAGGRPDNTFGEKLPQILRQEVPDTKQFSQKDQLVNALYRVDYTRPETCPFVIFPLGDTSQSTIDSLSSLVKMLFNQDSSSLRMITATAIEARDKQDEALEVDIGELINEQQQLKQRKEEIKRFKEIEPEFKLLEEQYRELAQQTTAEHAFAQRWLDLNTLIKQKEQVKNKLISEKYQFDAQKSSLGQHREGIKEKLTGHKYGLQNVRKELSKLEVKQKKVEELCFQYVGMTQEEVLEILSEELEKEEKALAEYTDKNQREQKIQSLKSVIETSISELEKLKNKAENEAHTLKNQITSNTWAIINTINSTLANANPGRALSNDEINAIEKFADLFQRQGNTIQFFDESLPILSELSTTSLQDEIFEKQSTINKTESELSTLVALNDGQTIRTAEMIKTLAHSTKKLNGDIALLKEAQSLPTRFKEEEEKEAHETAEIEQANALLDSTEMQYQALIDNSAQLKETIESMSRTITSLHARKESKRFVLSRYEHIKTLTETLIPNEIIDERSIEETAFNRDNAMLEKADRAKTTIARTLHNFIVQDVIEDKFQLLEGESSDKALLQTFEFITERYEALDNDIDVLDRDTKQHNAHVRNRLERLKVTRDKIENVVSQINVELAKTHINNLEGVKLVISRNGHFDSLVDSWVEFDDLGATDTLSSEWYTRLKNFLQSNAVDQKDGKLRMNNIITGARYHTKKSGDGWDEKDQSTSTKMLINMHLCDIFIQQLTSDASRIAFPLIMDEIGKVDRAQFPGLINGLNTKGHQLIGVTTHGKAADVIEAFEHYLIMDEITTGSPYDEARINICFPLEQIERITLKNQESLFEDVS